VYSAVNLLVFNALIPFVPVSSVCDLQLPVFMLRVPWRRERNYGWALWQAD